MALLLQNNTYVKLDINGNYLIYRSAENRKDNKNAISIRDVLKKYSEIITELLQDNERRYYDPSFTVEIQKWSDEATLYKDCVYSGNTNAKFPLMKKYIKNINKTIPEIVGRGQIGIQANTLTELYEKVKKLQIFGNSEEVKDI